MTTELQFLERYKKNKSGGIYLFIDIVMPITLLLTIEIKKEYGVVQSKISIIQIYKTILVVTHMICIKSDEIEWTEIVVILFCYSIHNKMLFSEYKLAKYFMTQSRSRCTKTAESGTV